MYEERDIMEGRLSDFYCEHMHAMTSEGLHDKSDIAAELAYRDTKIEELKRECDELLAYGERVSAAANRLSFSIVFDGVELRPAAEKQFAELQDVLAERSNAALSALKAEWQAEAVKIFLDLLDESIGTERNAGRNVSGDTIEMIGRAARKFSQRSQEIGDEK